MSGAVWRPEGRRKEPSGRCFSNLGTVVNPHMRMLPWEPPQIAWPSGACQGFCVVFVRMIPRLFSNYSEREAPSLVQEGHRACPHLINSKIICLGQNYGLFLTICHVFQSLGQTIKPIRLPGMLAEAPRVEASSCGLAVVEQSLRQSPPLMPVPFVFGHMNWNGFEWLEWKPRGIRAESALHPENLNVVAGRASV